MTNKTPTKKILTLREAIAVFDRYADRRDLGFWFARACCSERTHLMARELRRDGYKPGKAWAFAQSDSVWLRVRLPLSAAPSERWWYHVAPTLNVRINGRVKTMVFDPALFDGPVTRCEWGNAMNATPQNVRLRSFYASAPIEWGGNYSPGFNIYRGIEEYAREILDKRLSRQDFSIRTVFASRARAQAANKDLSIGWAGKEWQSIRAVAIDLAPSTPR